MDRLYALFEAARKQHPGKFRRVYTPYSLRHTFFIQYINFMLKHPDKISFFQISKMGGHSSEKTTRDAYSQYIESTNEIMAEAGNAALDWMLAETEKIRASQPPYGLKELTPSPKPILLPGKPSGRLHKRSPEMKERMKTAWANNHTPEAIAKRTAKRRKIKPELAAEIRKRIENGESQKAVAAEIGVTSATISNFINHKHGY
jgi:predicted XRE-type DNA-binding protein